jgi:hypothetical protein
MDPLFILVMIATCSYDRHWQLSALVISDGRCRTASRQWTASDLITDQLVHPLMMEREIHEKPMKQFADSDSMIETLSWLSADERLAIVTKTWEP